MGRDLAGSCARSFATGRKMRERNRGRVVLRATRGDNSFGMGIVYACARQRVKAASFDDWTRVIMKVVL